MMNIQNLSERIIEYIFLRHEGETWDFKRQWYDNDNRGKSNLMHDIICMANTIEDEDGLIIIGVDEEHDYAIRDVSADDNRRDTLEMVQFLRDKPFDGGVRPDVQVESLIIDGKTVDVVIVKNSTNVPFYLNERYKDVVAYHIYTRVGDSNTPVDKSADRDRVEALWKKRFGIGKDALQKFRIYLKDVDGWESIDGQQTFFYKPFPEFQIEIERDENRTGYEYYCFNQMDSHVGWYFIRLKCHETEIYKTSGIGLNKGNFFTSVPGDAVQIGSDFIYYYVEGTLQYDLMRFCLSKMTYTDYDSNARWNECMPVFKSVNEKDDFIKYLKSVKIKPVTKYDACVPDKIHYGEDGVRYRLQLSRAIGMTRLLEIFRRKREINTVEE